MNYKDYNAGDFAQDKCFREWINSGNAESDEFWNRWMAENPDKIPLINEARVIVSNMEFREFSLGSAGKNQLWEQIRHETEQPAQKNVPIRYLNIARYRHNNTGIRFNMWQFAAAAAVLLMVALSAFWLMQPGGTIDELVYSTGFGETREIALQDGSVVILNANTTIRMHSNWAAGGDREVWLDGEAFFDVRRNEDQQRFTVYAGTVGAQVLGTEFNVYSRAGKTFVELASGRLMLHDSITRIPVEMEPGDKVTYPDGYVAPLRSKFFIEEVASWKDNLLIFRRTSLAEIAALLKSNYDLDVIFEDTSIAEYNFTGTVPADDPDVLFKTLALSFELKIERSENTVIIQND